MDRRIRDEQIAFLQKVKPFLTRHHHVIHMQKPVEKVQVDPQTDEIIAQLIARIDKLEGELKKPQEESGPRTSKIKERIVEILRMNKKMTASQMADMISLSRTRCSEYFRELMLEGRVEGVIVDRQKYYKLVKP